MAKGRTTRLTVALTPAERQTLHAWQRSRSLPVRQARRARLLLLLAAGLGVSQTARAVGISRRHVYRWVARFQAQGLAGLHDRPRRATAHRAWRRVQPLDRSPGQP